MKSLTIRVGKLAVARDEIRHSLDELLASLLLKRLTALAHQREGRVGGVDDSVGRHGGDVGLHYRQLDGGSNKIGVNKTGKHAINKQQGHAS